MDVEGMMMVGDVNLFYIGIVDLDLESFVDVFVDNFVWVFFFVVVEDCLIVFLVGIWIFGGLCLIV